MRKVAMVVGLALLPLTGTAWGQEEVAPDAEPAAGPSEQGGAAPAPAVGTNSAPTATAQTAGRLIVGADAAFQLPFGNLAEVTGMGFGALVRTEYSLVPSLNGTFRVGYIYSLQKDTDGLKTSTDDIPVWMGTKYFLTDIIYSGAEVGLNLLWAKTYGTMGGFTQAQIALETKFGATIGAGALLGPLDVKAQLEILDFGHTGDSLALMVNVGYK